MIEFETSIETPDGFMPTFIVSPSGEGPLPPVVIYMDAPGIRAELRDLARRVAKAGYICVLPDMYYRLGTLRFDLHTNDPALRDLVFPAMGSLTIEKVMRDTRGIVGWVGGHERACGPIGVIGYCMSGAYVVAAAAEFPQITAVASLYGVGIVTDKENSPHLRVAGIDAEMYLAFAEHDPYVPEDVFAALGPTLESHGVRHEIERFPGSEHGFSFPMRPGYHPVAAEKSWAKVFGLLERQLKAGPEGQHQ